MRRVYTGVGSRETPSEVLQVMRAFVRVCATKDYVLRSGGARGADAAFEAGCQGGRKELPGLKEIYLPGDTEDWCYEEVQKYLDPGMDFNRFKPFTQDLLARNMAQVLGRDGKRPSDFLVCWTPEGADAGGTRYALRCARAYSVPVINMGSAEGYARTLTLMHLIEEEA